MARKKALPEADKTSGNKTKLKKNAAKAPAPAKKPTKSAKKSAVREKTTKIKADPAPPAKAKAKRTRKPHATRPTKEEEIEITNRRIRILELKKNGASVRRICALLQAEGFESCSIGTVQSDLTFILNEAQQQLSLDSGQWLTLMIERNEDQYFRLITSQIKGGVIIPDQETENTILRNQAQLDKFVGASKHERSKNAAAESLARLLGVDPDQLGEDDEPDDEDDESDD